MKEILIASRNKGKIAEFREMFQTLGTAVISLDDYEKDLPEIAETGSTFHENARLKAEGICEIVGIPVLADDSGLAIDALDGSPGVYSARFAGEDASDAQNNEKVLQSMQDVAEDARVARFVCVLALAKPEEETIFTEGFCEGKILDKPVGEHGFGYDPIFQPQGFDGSMAQLTSEEKNKISHRHHALVALQRALQTEK